MKRNLLLLLLFAVPLVSFAGKRLSVLTHTSQYKNERGVFTYDDQGRISRVDITDGQNNTSVATYTYDESRIVCNSDADNKVLEAVCDLEDGRVKMMSIYLSSENLVARDEFVYDGERFVSMYLYTTKKGEERLQERSAFTWDGDNVTEYYRVQYEGTSQESWKKLTFTPGNVSSIPLVNTLISCSFSTSPGFDDFVYMFGFYDHIGITPQNLPETVVLETDERPQGLYTYQYETNADGDVVGITITHESNGSSHVYTLEWEETAGINAVTSDSRRSCYYTLDGRRLQDAPSRSGVFLHDGKKYVVK